VIAYPVGKTPEQEAIENLLAEKERLEVQLEAALKQNAELVRSIEWRARTNHELNELAEKNEKLRRKNMELRDLLDGEPHSLT
jgi:hypothetical protein